VVKLVHATWDANASCAPPECSRTRSTCKARALDTGDIWGCKKWRHFTLSGLVRQKLAVPAPIFHGLVRLQAKLPRAFAAPRSHANVKHQPPVSTTAKRPTRLGKQCARGDLHIVSGSVPADVGRADDSCICKVRIVALSGRTHPRVPPLIDIPDQTSEQYGLLQRQESRRR
jgi:hypothetical protein